MSQKPCLIKDNYPPLASVFWEYDFAYGAPHLIVIWFKPVRACSQGSIPRLRVGSFITSPGNTGSHRIGIVSFYSSSFLGKHWPQKQGQYQKLLPLPTGKAELAHTLGLPRSLACGTFSFRRRSCLSGSSMGSLRSCFPLPRAALRVGVFGRPILFVLVLHCDLQGQKRGRSFKDTVAIFFLDLKILHNLDKKSQNLTLEDSNKLVGLRPRLLSLVQGLREAGPEESEGRKRPPFSRMPLLSTTRLPLGSQSAGLAQSRRLTWRDAPVPTDPPPHQVPRGTPVRARAHTRHPHPTRPRE